MTKPFSLLFVPVIGMAAMAEAQNLTNNSYQYEIGAGYSTSDSDYLTESNDYSIDGTYYFSPVQLKSHPYAEAAFMERAGFATLGAGYSESEQNIGCFTQTQNCRSTREARAC